MVTLAKRLKFLLKEKGINQTQFAQMVGITQPSMQKILSGDTKNPRKILAMAEVLGVNPIWLQNGGNISISDGSKLGMENSQINNNQGQTVNNFFGNLPASEVDAVHKNSEGEWIYALNINQVAGFDVVNSRFQYHFEALHLSDEGLIDLLRMRSTKNIFMISMFNDSMLPLIKKKDVIFVDTTYSKYEGEGVYLFVINNELFVRNLQQLPSGVLKAIAMNEKSYSFELDSNTLRNMKFLGKCIRKLSLQSENL